MKVKDRKTEPNPSTTRKRGETQLGVNMEKTYPCALFEKNKSRTNAQTIPQSPKSHKTETMFFRKTSMSAKSIKNNQEIITLKPRRATALARKQRETPLEC